jgi:hypothetical protein
MLKSHTRISVHWTPPTPTPNRPNTPAAKELGGIFKLGVKNSEIQFGEAYGHIRTNTVTVQYVVSLSSASCWQWSLQNVPLAVQTSQQQKSAHTSTALIAAATTRTRHSLWNFESTDFTTCTWQLKYNGLINKFKITDCVSNAIYILLFPQEKLLQYYS